MDSCLHPTHRGPPESNDHMVHIDVWLWSPLDLVSRDSTLAGKIVLCPPDKSSQAGGLQHRLNRLISHRGRGRPVPEKWRKGDILPSPWERDSNHWPRNSQAKAWSHSLHFLPHKSLNLLLASYGHAFIAFKFLGLSRDKT